MIDFNYMVFKRILQVFTLSLALAPPALALDARAHPEGASAPAAYAQSAQAKDFMIVTANPLATKAGYEILQRGGNAVDAMVAAQAVLGLTEPQSSGFGGGAFVLYYDAQEKRLSGYDGRETAPALAGPYLFHENGAQMAFRAAQRSGKSVGVPGVPRLLEDLHQRYGQRTWMELFQPATTLAEEGFAVSPRLATLIADHAASLGKNPAAARYFLDAQGAPLAAGAMLRNPDYAAMLKDFAFSGADIFYGGPYGERIVQAIQNVPAAPGFMTDEDMRGYALKTRRPVCAPYRVYKVCSAAEPSSGGLAVLQALGMLEAFDLKALGAENVQSWRLIAQASALAFADRNQYVADPDFVKTPGVLLLDPAYLAQRAALLDADKPLAGIDIQAGTPPLWDGALYTPSAGLDAPGTSHISIVDAAGNVLSMTTTIESAFGAHIMVDGYLLNNELTDFDFQPFGADGKKVANMVEGGKRPRSSMAPVIVFDLAGKPVMTIGSAGGSNIIGYVLQRLVAVLDWGMPLPDSLAMPSRLAKSAQKIEVEKNDGISMALAAKGDALLQGTMNSGLTAILIREDNKIGAADPRREGTAMGE